MPKSSTNFTYNPEDTTQTLSEIEEKVVDRSPRKREVSWQGSEFVANHKTASWYVVFFLGFAAVVVGTYFATRQDLVSTVSIAVVGVLFMFMAGHKPRTLNYSINNQGINIGSKFYGYHQFKSFELARDGAIEYISLTPLKRFMPEISIYFPPEQGQRVVSMLKDYLPHHETRERFVDKLARKLHF